MKIKSYSLIIFCITAFTTAAFASDATNDTKIAELTGELQQAGQEYGKYYNTHDIDGIMTFIDERSIVVDWHGNAAVGRDQIRAFFEKTFKDNPHLKLSSELQQAQVIDDQAVMTFGTLTFSGHGTYWPSSSKFSVLWKKIDGHWTTYYDTGMIPMK